MCNCIRVTLYLFYSFAITLFGIKSESIPAMIKERYHSEDMHLRIISEPGACGMYILLIFYPISIALPLTQ